MVTGPPKPKTDNMKLFEAMAARHEMNQQTLQAAAATSGTEQSAGKGNRMTKRRSSEVATNSSWTPKPQPPPVIHVVPPSQPVVTISPLSASQFTASISPLSVLLANIVEKYRANSSGKLADYIPALTRANPNHCGVCIVTTTGETYVAGDWDVEFTIQSISKALTYDLALLQKKKEVLAKVGVEPSGEAFNSVKIDSRGRPPNPMVNIGAIQIASMIDDNDFARILGHFSKYSGRQLRVDEEVCASETETGFKNFALAYLLKNQGLLEASVEKSTSTYFRQCSVLINSKDLAMIAATLANCGVNPVTGEIVTQSSNVAQVLSVMATCGMYNYAGSWMCEVGLPAKSGVGGGICCVVPGVLGVGVFSPLLDEVGNSVRGIEICHELSEVLGLSMFQPFSMMLAVPFTQAVILSESIQIVSGVPCAILKITGNMSIVGTERVVAYYHKLYFDRSRVLVFDMNAQVRFDSGGLVLTELFSKTMKKSGRFLIVSMERSSSSLKLHEKLGAEAMIPELSALETKLMSVGLAKPAVPDLVEGNENEE
eukprot:c9038_g1_i1.p1 GENE.c9038_g1_i1~~c9038_g1_i1.p1  ORF type:complete len:542 (-),score=133.71 c9038_g1_i1:42-1667(-)